MAGRPGNGCSAGPASVAGHTPANPLVRESGPDSFVQQGPAEFIRLLDMGSPRAADDGLRGGWKSSSSFAFCVFAVRVRHTPSCFNAATARQEFGLARLAAGNRAVIQVRQVENLVGEPGDGGIVGDDQHRAVP